MQPVVCLFAHNLRIPSLIRDRWQGSAAACARARVSRELYPHAPTAGQHRRSDEGRCNANYEKRCNRIEHYADLKNLARVSVSVQ
jgi:hypothetical protein